MKNDFNSSMSQRSPVVPFFGGEVSENYKDDKYLSVLCELLESNAPDLLGRFRHIVIESSNQWEEGKKELKQLEEERFDLIGKIQCQEDRLDYQLTQLPKEPKENKWQMVLTAGLSIFMIVGVAKLFNTAPDELIWIDSLQRLIVLIMSIIAAAAINIAERKAIESHVKYTFDSDRQATERKNKGIQNDSDDKRSPSSIRKVFRNPALVVALTMLICETAFVSEALVSTSEYSVAKSVPLPIAIAASALASLVNISMAWGSALQMVSWERDNLKERRAIVEKHFSDDWSFFSKEQLHDLEKRVEKKSKEVEQARKLSVEEHVRFSEDLSERLIPKVFGVNETVHSSVGESQYAS